MNKFFDFTNRQLKFVALLSGTALVIGGYLFIRASAYRATELPSLEISIGENQQIFTGVFTLDPNSAPADSLELIPGIGSVLADRIITYREQQSFEEPVDLTNIKGIGPHLYERIKPYIRINRC